MAAADITVGRRIATIECDSTKHVITLDNVPKAAITNLGPSNVFIRDIPETGDLARDGAQRIGEVELEVGDSFPLPDGNAKFEQQCLAAQTSKLWYVPVRG